MTALELAVIDHPRRRTHLSFSVTWGAYATACGLTLSGDDAGTRCMVPLIGGATTRLRNDLVRELNRDNTCKRCARIAGAMLALYVARDKGRRP